jgi:Kef-type K+ transport system membrane component KefB
MLVILLLPLFFVFTGLKTEIGLINDPYLWKVTGFIMVAVVGKFLGSALAAKFGQTGRQLTIGALMNTRVNGIDCIKYRVRAQGSDS